MVTARGKVIVPARSEDWVMIEKPDNYYRTAFQ